MTADRLQHRRIEPLHQRPGGVFVAFLDLSQPGGLVLVARAIGRPIVLEHRAKVQVPGTPCEHGDRRHSQISGAQSAPALYMRSTVPKSASKQPEIGVVRAPSVGREVPVGDVPEPGRVRVQEQEVCSAVVQVRVDVFWPFTTTP